MNSEKRLNDLLEHFLELGIPGVALTVNYKGREVFKSYKGLARKEDNKEVDINTIYQIFSCSKLVTTAAVMQLYERGLILLNDPLENYLPYFKDLSYQTYDGSGETTIHRCTNPILVKDLLMMTSGIPYPGRGTTAAADYNDKWGGFLGSQYALTCTELAKEIAAIPLEFDPGTRWHYGYGFDVLGALVEAVSGMKFGEYLKKNIFEPLEMTDTTFDLTNAMREDLAATYARTPDGEWINIGMEPMLTEDNDNKFESGGGGLLSTMGDLANFSEMLANGGIFRGKRILGSASIELISMNHLEGQPLEDFRKMSRQAYPHYIGYGWGLGCRTLLSKTQAGSLSSVGEFGWCGATGPYVLADPSKELAITFMMQTQPVIGGLQDYVHPRVRNAVYSLLDEWD